MDFQMQITSVGVRAGASDKSINLGVWSSGFDNNLTLIDPQIMLNFTADVVYRISVVEVKIFYNFWSAFIYRLENDINLT